MKKFLRLILIITISAAIVCCTNAVYAAFEWKDIDGSADNFLTTGGTETYFTQADLGNLVNGIVGVLVSIGAVAAFGTLLVLGIKYMTASPEEASKLKPKIIGAIISAVVVVAAVGIWQLLGVLFANSSGGVPLNETDFGKAGVSTALRTPTPKPKTTPTPAAASSIKFSTNSVKLNQVDNREYTISYIVEPASAAGTKVTFTSDDESVATVDKNGVVKAAGRGTTTIRGTTSNGKEATLSVEVEVPNLGKIFDSSSDCSGKTVKYWGYIPDVDTVNSYQNISLIVSLHPRGVDSITGVGNSGLPKYIKSGDAKPKAIVIAPLDSNSRVVGGQGNWSLISPDLVYSLIQNTILEMKDKGIFIDESNICITGHSMGGAAAFEVIKKYPDLFNKAVLVSPQEDPTNASQTKCPIRVYFGADETAQNYPAKWQTAASNNSNISFTSSTQYRDHGAITKVYKDLEVLSWMTNT